ncbi:MAG: 3-isopropylmalate dehydrogenase [Spirochaetales bacterium]|nr:3-isopropylmalate dehydrogenase [Spirochaetales bacterium]
MKKKIAVLPGDGIGPEVMAEAIKVMAKIEKKYDIQVEQNWADVGGIAIDNHGNALPDSTITTCENADAILFGSVGGPKWEKLPPEKQPERGALLPLRKHFNLFANLRPAIVFRGLAGASPLKPEIIGEELDVLVVRELTGGLYFGQPKYREGDKAVDTMIYTRPEIERIAHIAFQAARQRGKKLCSIDKANVLTTMVFWREVVTEVGKQYPDVALSHMYVDNAAMQLVRNPRQFDVLLAENMFGDILSDEASMIAGSLGMLPSASLAAPPQGKTGAFGLFEPSGGSAPDIAGQGIANPIAQILSMGMMFQYAFGMPQVYNDVHQAVASVLAQGHRTRDISTPGQTSIGTQKMGDLIAQALS